MSTWYFKAEIVDAATDAVINSGAQVYYGTSPSVSTTSSYKLNIGSNKAFSVTSGTSFYFKAVLDQAKADWVVWKWSCYCPRISTSSSNPKEFTENPCGPWNLSSVAQNSSSTYNVVTLYICDKNVSVTFNGNGGSAPSEPKTVTLGKPFGYLPTPTRPNYAFVGWYTAASGGTLVTPDTEVSDPKDIALYAHWVNATSATITFNAHGGTGAPSQISFTTGTAVTIPEGKPTRSEYIFAGWAVDSNAYQVEYFPGKTYYPTSSLYLYAAWRKPLPVQSYSSSSMVNQDRTLFSAKDSLGGNNTAVILLDGTHLPSGVFFIPTLSPYLYGVNCWINSVGYADPRARGMFIAVDLGGEYRKSTMSGAIGSTNISIQEGTNTAATASVRQFVAAPTFAGSSTNGDFCRDLTLGIDVDALEADGLEFEGWFYTEAGGTVATGYYTGTDAWLRYGNQLPTLGMTSLPNNKHCMIAPLVRKRRYVCAFDAQGGTVTPAFKYVTYQDAYGTLPTPVLSGYSFVGWYTAASGGTRVLEETIFTSKLDHILYAHWSTVGQTRTIYFDAAGGTCPTASKSATVGSAVGTLPTATRSGYTFVGWFRSTVGNDQVTAQTIMGEENMTLYAHWSATTVTITFNANGGTVDEPSRTVPYGRQIQRLPLPVRPGQAFDGWFTAATGGTEITKTTIATTSLEVYAHWRPNSASLWSVTTF